MKLLTSKDMNHHLAVIFVLTVILTTGFQAVQAWTTPSNSAPNGNVSAPITTRSGSQTKQGTLLLLQDLGVARNAVLGTYVDINNTSGVCLSGICNRTWPTGNAVNAITGGSGITVNNSTGNVTMSVDVSDVMDVMFSNVTIHSCNIDAGRYTRFGVGDWPRDPDPMENPRYCSISGTKRMCWLSNVFGVDGDDIDGFGCSVTGTPGSSNWQIRNVGEDWQQVYCEATCINF